MAKRRQIPSPDRSHRAPDTPPAAAALPGIVREAQPEGAGRLGEAVAVAGRLARSAPREARRRRIRRGSAEARRPPALLPADRAGREIDADPGGARHEGGLSDGTPKRSSGGRNALAARREPDPGPRARGPLSVRAPPSAPASIAPRSALIERGQRVPRLDTIVKLAGAVEVEPCVLLVGMAWELDPPKGDSSAARERIDQTDDLVTRRHKEYEEIVNLFGKNLLYGRRQAGLSRSRNSPISLACTGSMCGRSNGAGAFPTSTRS